MPSVELDHVYNIVTALGRVEKRAELAALLSENLSRFVEFDVLSLLLISDSGAKIDILNKIPLNKKAVSSIEAKLKKNLFSILGKERFASDFTTEVMGARDQFGGEALQAELLLPLLSGLEVVGILHLQSARSGLFQNEEEIKILCILATQLAVIAERINSFEKLALEREKLRRHLFELSIIHEISRNIGYSIDIFELSKTVMQLLEKIVDLEIGASLVVEEDLSHLYILKKKPASGDCINRIKSHLIAAYDSLSRTPLDAKKTLFDNVEHYSQDKEPEEIGEIKSTFDIPIFRRDRVVGILNLSSSREHAFSMDDLQLLKTISHQMSVVIENLDGIIAAEKMKLSSVIDSTSEGIMLIDDKSQPALLNPSARKILEIREDLTPADLSFLEKFNLPDLVPEFASALNDIRSRKSSMITKDLVLSEPYPRVIRLIFEPVKDSRDKIMGILVLLRDITEERQKEELKSGFLSAVSHELRTPLSVIKEGIEVVLSGITGTLNDKQKKYLNVADKNINDLKINVNQLLAMAELESPTISIKKGKSDYVKVLKASLEILSSKIKEKKIRLLLKVPKTPLKMNIDQSRIQQIILNLAGNAIKFTKPGGKIAISVKLEKGMVITAVADRGRGIRLQDQEKLFRPFYELNTSLSRTERGMGIGLALCRAYVEAHRGKIWLDSVSGKGSTFYFTLPLKNIARKKTKGLL